MVKRIVIFGCDNSGKTTLANNLSKELDAVVLKPLGPADLKTQMKHLDNCLLMEESIIFDRFPPIEEEVCGNVFRLKNNFLNCPEDSLKFYYDSIDLFIFCNPSISSVVNWGEREQMKGVKENVPQLISGYIKKFLELRSKNCKVVEYNWEKDSIEKIIKEVVE